MTTLFRYLIFFTVVVPTSTTHVLCQDNVSYFSDRIGVQYGYSIKAVFEISPNCKEERIHFKLGFSGGIGAFTGNEWFYPAINTDVMLYHGGMGSSRPKLTRGNFLDVEAIVSYSFVFGFENRLRQASSVKPGIRNYPLYYFNNWAFPTLQNPFRYSATWGGNWAVFLTRRPYRSSQFVGFINVHVDRIQGSYTNDGPPFFLPFGDKFDRYHTGGGFLSFHGDDSWFINLVEIGYNKFTGYSPGTYEVSNQLGVNYMFYHDLNQNFYNKSNWQFNIANTSKHIGGSLQIMNHPVLDMQHRIHNRAYYPFHLVPYPSFFSLGPTTYFQRTFIGLK